MGVQSDRTLELAMKPFTLDGLVRSICWFLAESYATAVMWDCSAYTELGSPTLYGLNDGT